MKKLIDWLFQRVRLYRSDKVIERDHETGEVVLFVNVGDLEEAIGNVELPNQDTNHFKCAYRRMVEDLEAEDLPENTHLQRCYDCIGYNEGGKCHEYVSVEELTKFYEMFKK